MFLQNLAASSRACVAEVSAAEPALTGNKHITDVSAKIGGIISRLCRCGVGGRACIDGQRTHH